MNAKHLLEVRSKRLDARGYSLRRVKLSLFFSLTSNFFFLFSHVHFSALKLTHFRNYESLSLEFGGGVNCITGDNGAGKTSILESIHYLAMTRGFQARGEQFSLKEGETFFISEGIVEQEDGQKRIQCNFLQQKGKKILLNGKPLRTMAEHLGSIPVVTVLPNDTQLIYGGPSGRRKFMDAFISQYDAEYLNALIRYDKAITQRNALLNSFAERRTFDKDQLDLWTQHLVGPGQIIHRARMEFLEAYHPVFTKYFKLIVSEKETPIIAYESQIEDNTPAGWNHLFNTVLTRDRAAQRSTTGVHKDDLAFRIDGQPVKNFGSQGQQKTFLIALKFAQYELLEQRKKTPPILLLDDIFDKLDIHRLRAIAGILDQIVQGQVFITDTSLERTVTVFSEVKERPVQFYKVVENKVSNIEVNRE